MKKLTTIALVISSLLIGCSETPQETEIKVQADGKPLQTIHIAVEGKKDVVVEDPFIGEIQTLSTEFDAKRSHFLKERNNMTKEQRKAYGEYRDTTAERIRELQSQRKAYIAEQMKLHNGTDFKLVGSDLDKAVDSASGYFDKSK